MNIFSDRHHAGLAYSLHLLFEKRLGGSLFFPIGMEWAENFYWQIHKPYNYNLDTAKQYLQIKPEYIPKDGSPTLNKVVGEETTHYEVEDVTNHYIQKCITLDQFKVMPIDIIIASVPDHVASFKRLRDAFHPEAKLVFQMGNMFTEVLQNLHEIPNLLSSTIAVPVPSSCNAVFYHQEFDLSIFHPGVLQPAKKITSFINCLPQSNRAGQYYQLKQELPEYQFKSYGITCDDGTIGKTEEIASIMGASQWGAHLKWGGDGFGHVLYNWFACGVPVITCMSDYKDKLGGELLEDGETCIDLDSHSLTEVVKMIGECSKELKYTYMSQQVVKRFKEKVNYDEEEQKIRQWVERLQ